MWHISVLSGCFFFFRLARGPEHFVSSPLNLALTKQLTRVIPLGRDRDGGFEERGWGVGGWESWGRKEGETEGGKM